MPKFQKKPVVIEAVQYDGTDECARRIGLEITVTETGIQTLEGFMRASPGDWIITGVKGERYPCKPDVFEATYGPVTPAPAPDLARVTQERDAALSRVAALEAAVAGYAAAQRAQEIRDAAEKLAALDAKDAKDEPVLARHQTCGCVVYRCEDEERCNGCGAKWCGTHPVGDIPNALYDAALDAKES